MVSRIHELKTQKLETNHLALFQGVLENSQSTNPQNKFCQLIKFVRKRGCIISTLFTLLNWIFFIVNNASLNSPLMVSFRDLEVMLPFVALCRLKSSGISCSVRLPLPRSWVILGIFFREILLFTYNNHMVRYQSQLDVLHPSITPSLKLLHWQ